MRSVVNQRYRGDICNAVKAVKKPLKGGAKE